MLKYPVFFKLFSVEKEKMGEKEIPLFHVKH